ncbi:MAG: ChrR family anti-sigma-E factor [Alphaproteobacteria bacterium]
MMHHPPEDLLLDYATGTLSRAQALLIASHLTYCPVCRHRLTIADEIAATMAEEAAPAIALEQVSAASILAAADAAPANTDARASARRRRELTRPAQVLPRPLRDAIAPNLDAVSWMPLFPGIWESRLPANSDRPDCDEPGEEARLLCIGAGRSIPSHTHGGLEMTLVLAGSFSDTRGHYGVGDVCMADGSIDHRPVAASDQDCICFAVVDAPMRFTGRIGRLLNILEPHLARARHRLRPGQS